MPRPPWPFTGCMRAKSASSIVSSMVCTRVERKKSSALEYSGSRMALVVLPAAATALAAASAVPAHTAAPAANAATDNHAARLARRLARNLSRTLRTRSTSGAMVATAPWAVNRPPERTDGGTPHLLFHGRAGRDGRSDAVADAAVGYALSPPLADRRRGGVRVADQPGRRRRFGRVDRHTPAYRDSRHGRRREHDHHGPVDAQARFARRAGARDRPPRHL